MTEQLLHRDENSMANEAISPFTTMFPKFVCMWERVKRNHSFTHTLLLASFVFKEEFYNLFIPKINKQFNTHGLRETHTLWSFQKPCPRVRIGTIRPDLILRCTVMLMSQRYYLVLKVNIVSYRSSAQRA